MKRFFDIILSFVLMPFLLLFGTLISLLILFVDNHSPFFFKQKRIGKDGKEFYCLKFQCLKPPKSEAEINDKKRDKLRATKLGDFLKDRGLDELPQILNILVGKMSFVGPRPYLEKNIKLIEDLNPQMINDVNLWKNKRSQVLPGLSGWHQIHTIGPRVIKYDLEYLEDPSFSKHLKVFLVSILILFVGKNFYFNKIKLS